MVYQGIFAAEQGIRARIKQTGRSQAGRFKAGARYYLYCCFVPVVPILKATWQSQSLDPKPCKYDILAAKEK